jgi:hypothetical protein
MFIWQCSAFNNETKYLLRYETQTYPKGENKRYDASYQPSTQLKLL